MKCPVCPDMTLTMTQRQGIEIDYCPQCRGVWLDRGELDKIIERSGNDKQTVQQVEPYQPQQPYGSRSQPHGRHDYHERKHSHHKSFWKELFD